MASVKNYNAKTNFKNQESYLKNLQQKGNIGEKKWANKELKSLCEAADKVARESAYSVNAGTAQGVDSAYLFGRSSGYGSAGVVNPANNGAEAYYKNYNAYRDYYEQAQEAKAQKKAAANAVNSIQSQMPSLNSYYDKLQKLNLAKQRQEEKNLPQKLAAAGLTGGQEEKELDEVQSNYESLFKYNEAARKATLAEMQENINAIKLKGSSSVSENAAKWQKKLAELWRGYESLLNA